MSQDFFITLIHFRCDTTLQSFHLLICEQPQETNIKSFIYMYLANNPFYPLPPKNIKKPKPEVLGGRGGGKKGTLPWQVTNHWEKRIYQAIHTLITYTLSDTSEKLRYYNRMFAIKNTLNIIVCSEHLLIFV